MHILFLTDNFPPEVNAPATRTHEHCREWVKAGHTVTVVTCAPNFPKGKVFDGYRNLPFQREEMDGISVIRVWSYITANEGFLKRVLDYTSFMATAMLVAPADAETAEAAVVEAVHHPAGEAAAGAVEAHGLSTLAAPQHIVLAHPRRRQIASRVGTDAHALDAGEARGAHRAVLLEAWCAAHGDAVGHAVCAGPAGEGQRPGDGAVEAGHGGAVAAHHAVAVTGGHEVRPARRRGLAGAVLAAVAGAAVARQRDVEATGAARHDDAAGPLAAHLGALGEAARGAGAKHGRAVEFHGVAFAVDEQEHVALAALGLGGSGRGGKGEGKAEQGVAHAPA